MAATKVYRSEDANHYFTFHFVDHAGRVDIYCLEHPSLEGRDPDPHKTHLFSSGQLCFVAGREPSDQDEAEALAKIWAEYFLEYIKTGIAQN